MSAKNKSRSDLFDEYFRDLLQDWGEWEEVKHTSDFAHGGAVHTCKRHVLNNFFVIQITEEQTQEFGTVDHLWILRRDRLPIMTWEILHEIKNQVCGEDAVAIEVFPRASDFVQNPPNMRHLYVLPKGRVLSFGLHAPRKGKPDPVDELAEDIADAVVADLQFELSGDELAVHSAVVRVVKDHLTAK